jgi:hypothetical protein
MKMELELEAEHPLMLSCRPLNYFITSHSLYYEPGIGERSSPGSFIFYLICPVLNQKSHHTIQSKRNLACCQNEMRK